jgi:hypothetical protein
LSDLVRTDVPTDFEKQIKMAEYYAGSSLLPAHLRGKPANVLIILAGARSLGISAFWALQSMHVVDGKLSLAAELMRGLAVRAGHKVRIVKRDMDSAIVEITRSDDPEPYRVEFTWKEAIDAGLQNKDNWKKYRKAMMVARATSAAMRDHCPDVLFGITYTPDELGAIENEDGTITDPAAVIPGEEVQPPDPQAIAKLLALVAEAKPAELLELGKDAKNLGILHHPAGAGTVQGEIVLRMKYLIDDIEVSQEDLRTLWRLGGGLDLLNTAVTIKNLNMETEVVTLADAITLKRKMLEEVQAAAEADPKVDDIQDAEIVDDPAPDVATNIDTENAEALRQQARDSWGDQDVPDAR